jgi:hypothetical protein
MQVFFYLFTTLSIYNRYLQLSFYLSQPLLASFYLLTTLSILSVYDRYLQLSLYLSQPLLASFYLFTTLSIYDKYLQLAFYLSLHLQVSFYLLTLSLSSLSMTVIYSCPSTCPCPCSTPSTCLYKLTNLSVYDR